MIDPANPPNDEDDGTTPSRVSSSKNNLNGVCESPLHEAMRAKAESPLHKALQAKEDSPFQKAMQAMEDSPFQKAIRAMEDSPFQKAIRAMEDSPLHKAMQAMEDGLFQKAIRSMEASSLHKAIGAMDTSPLREAMRVMEVERFPALMGNPAMAFLPSRTLIESLGGEIARMISPFEHRPIAVWETNLTARMSELEAAWAMPDSLSESMQAFAQLSRLSETVRAPDPYSAQIDEAVMSALGRVREPDDDGPSLDRDLAAIEAGLNPGPIAFPAASYGRVTVAAGFSFNFAVPDAPQAIEQAGIAATFDPNHNVALTQVEQKLRRLIEERLQIAAGDRWMKQRVPQELRARWLEKQQNERQAGRPVYSLIHYADFMDLRDVICRGDNWREVFAPIFRHQDEFVTSLRRLHPIRLALAHSRPLCRADVLTLVTESMRILGACGVQVLS